MSTKNFSSLGLDEGLLSVLREEGYSEPSPIQLLAIEPILAGRDLLGLAQTGTGKTAAFALPIIQNLLQSPDWVAPRGARVLILAPTRELAIQIDESFATYGRKSGLRRACIFGGVGSSAQERALRDGVDILTATPGRLLDLAGQGKLSISQVQTVVFDEADRMFDMGFIHDIKRIVALLPKKRQTLLFSATMPKALKEFTATFLTKPVQAEVPHDRPSAENIEQRLLYVEKINKRHLLSAIIKEDGFSRVIVFTRTKHGANRLSSQLGADGLEAQALHANKSQGQRQRTMRAFREGKLPILVATDIAARGIDVDDIELVVNFDLPNEAETYVHRIGRTARAGAAGLAISFCTPEEKDLLRNIERFLRIRIPIQDEHPFAIDPETPPMAAPSKVASKGRPEPSKAAPKGRPESSKVAPKPRPEPSKAAPKPRPPRPGKQEPKTSQRGRPAGKPTEKGRPAQNRDAQPGNIRLTARKGLEVEEFGVASLFNQARPRKKTGRREN